MSFQYTVSTGPSASGPWAQFNVTSSTTDTITGLAPGTSYFVQIVVTDTVTGLSSAPLVSGPFGTSALPGESADGTAVTATTQTIYASQTPGTAAPQGGTLDTWTLSSAPGPTCEVVHNGVADTTTNSLVSLFYTGHFVYQQATNTNSQTPAGGTTGWWQWNPSSPSAFNGWVEAPSPVPTAPTISFNQIANQSLNTPFAVSGVLQNYASVPTLTYNDNGGTFVALPSGASVTRTSFTFTHPAITNVGSADTVGLKDPSGNTGVSNAFVVASPTITGITLSSTAFAANTTPPVTVGTIGVLFSGGVFSGTLSLGGTNAASFTISGNQLRTSSSLAAGTYNINIVATQAGAGGSPFTQAFTLSAQSGAAVGPAASGNFINFDFTNTSGVSVSQYLWGVADGGDIGQNSFTGKGTGGLTSTSIQSALQSAAFSMYRFNSQCGYTELAFPNGATAASQSTLNSVFGNLINIFPRIAPNARLVLGLGFPPTNWSSAANFASMCTTVCSYLKTTLSTATSAPLPIYGFEIGNENNLDPGIPSWYSQYFNAGAAAIKAVNSNWKVFGPVFSFADSLQQFAQGSGSSCDVLDYHAYAYGGQSDFNSKGGQTSMLGTRLLSGLQNDANSYALGGGSSSIPIFIGEYNQNNTFGTLNGGQSPGTCNTFMQNATGAVFNANCILSGLNANPNFSMATIWSVFQDSDYGMIGGTDNVNSGNFALCPGGWFLSQASKVLYGTRVAGSVSTNGGGASTTVLAAKSGTSPSGFAVMAVNSSLSNTFTGKIAFSHWPVNASGNGTVNRWEVSNNNPVPATSTVSVTAGLTATTSIPPVSVVIYYSL